MESLRDELANISNQDTKSPQTVEVAVNVTQPDAGDKSVASCDVCNQRFFVLAYSFV
jgi:hypothetical protein